MLAGGESGVQRFVFFLEDRQLTADFMLMGITQSRGNKHDNARKERVSERDTSL